MTSLDRQLAPAIEIAERFQQRWGPYQPHRALEVDAEQLAAAWREYAKRLDDNYPFFHPRYAGQMLKPPHPVAVAAYLAAMTINPNNHALDGGPATGAMEKELVKDLAAMFHLPGDTLGHLTSSGTIANLEALWVARQLHPGKAIAYSQEAHYTHERMCGVLGVDTVPVPADDAGRIDLDALERELRTGAVGTVVLTAGTTGLGALDPIHQALELRERYGCRLHVDAAYGGFFALLAWADDPLVAPEPLRAIAACDSVVVDPHKHGLQPYGCGAVTSCTSARSAWSARGPARPPARCGSPCGCCRWRPSGGSARCSPPASTPPGPGPGCWRAATCSACTCAQSSTS